MEEAGPIEELHLESPGGERLLALINGDRGLLLYARHVGDPGFVSLNPEFSGWPDDLVAFRLNNGQVDSYPGEHVISAVLVREAIEYFKRTRRPPTFVTWLNDSGDGKEITDAV